MKVTSVEIIEAKHYLFVKVHTDAGITGLGEAGNWGFLQATKGAIQKFSEFIIGQDPFKIEHHYQNMYRAMYFRGSVIMSAISALEIALWDIKGKALGVPVYELLGGKTRDRIRNPAKMWRSWVCVFPWEMTVLQSRAVRSTWAKSIRLLPRISISVSALWRTATVP